MKKLTKREHDIIYKPRTGEEMSDATLHKVPIHKYSDLCRIARKTSPASMLAQMFKQSPDHIILLQDPSDMNSGHWISVSRNPLKREFYFFSTYGGKPDVEKIQWMCEDDLRQSGQDLNIFNDGLHEAQKHGWEIHYNDYPYQKSGDQTAVCGIFTAAFLRSGKNPDEFERMTKEIIKQGQNPAIVYFDRYFK